MPRPHNDTPLTAEQRELAGSPVSLALAAALSRGWVRRFPRLADDIRSAALLGLVDAAGRFDPARAGWRTFAAPRVRGSVLDALRAAGLKGFRRNRRGAPPRLVPLSAPVRCEDGPRPLGELLPSAELPVGWEAEGADEVLALTRPLPADQREALRGYHLEAGMTMLRIGRRLGVSDSMVSRLTAAAMAELRDHAAAVNPGSPGTGGQVRPGALPQPR